MSNYARAEMPAVYSYTEFTNYEFLIAKAYRIILSADTASEVRQMLSQKRR